MKNLTGLLCSLLTLSATALNIERLPIKEEDVDAHSAITVSRSPGCPFGGQMYDLDSKWHPILEPYGVMYCLQCACIPVIKKDILQSIGVVQCRKISGDCPDVSGCAQAAVLPPNSCCKVCPDNTDNPHLVAAISPVARSSRLEPQSAADNGLSSQSSTKSEYIALLRSSVSGVFGRAQLLIDKTSARISIELSREIQLDTLQFISKDGHLLHQQSLWTNQQQDYNQPGLKLCGIWPTALKYRQELSSGIVSLVVSSKINPASTLRGVVQKPSSLLTETFSSLLMNTEYPSYVAAITYNIDLKDNSLILRGIINIAETRPQTKELVLMDILRDSRVLFTQDQMVSLGGWESGEFSMKWQNLSSSLLKQLARGRLSARLLLSRTISISGPINTWQRCGSLQALITGADVVPRNPSSAVAVATLQLLPGGNIDYKLKFMNMQSRSVDISIEGDRHGGGGALKFMKISKEVDLLTGTVSGVYDKPDAREVQLLSEGKLFMYVEFREKQANTLRGQIALTPYGVFTEQMSDPVLMSDGKTGMAAVAWCGSIDCSMSCSILVPHMAVKHDKSTKVFLNVLDQQTLLASFDSEHQVEVVVSKGDLLGIGSSTVTLQVVTSDAAVSGQVSVPAYCTDGDSINSRARLPVGDAGRSPTWVDPNLVPTYQCSYDDNFYADGESWKPRDSSHECSTCSCKRNKVQCHPVVCPHVTCDKPVMLSGECCLSCPKPSDDTSKQCYFEGDHRQHRHGTLWHPFMHPNGYFKCTVCFCKSDGSGYDCKPTQCPTLACDERLAIRKPSDCCLSCPEESNSLTIAKDGVRSSVQADSDLYSACKVADQLYSNGEMFNPEIGAFGIIGSIQCKCNNGEVKCKPIECDCKKKLHKRSLCCAAKCDPTEKDLEGSQRKFRQKGKRYNVHC